ncbi:hypothetical protein GGS26DRAFT_585719 [Hypomontagnella submonticulosa]|nr:hypothetical protein GGS26DRAFT_585719 [Hypomontagnella submonticulosa]
MPSSSPTPSLLLTKRLTAFLSSNLSPQIHTAALTTLSGKLLAYASPHGVSTLRTQCTVAASIWALYSTQTASDAVSHAQPPVPRNQSSDFTSLPPDPTPSAVTVQLAAGVLVVRKLRCGLLFVCLGPTTTDGGGAGGEAQSQGQGQGGRPVPASTLAQPAAEPPGPTPLGSPSESIASVAATTASIATTASVAASAVVATRRQAEELARWLDDKLGSLGELEEGIPTETR